MVLCHNCCSWGLSARFWWLTRKKRVVWMDVTWFVRVRIGWYLCVGVEMNGGVEILTSERNVNDIKLVWEWLE